MWMHFQLTKRLSNKKLHSSSYLSIHMIWIFKIFYYFNFTNKSTEATSAVVSSYFQCFQNGIECETTFLEGENAEYNNLSKDIQQGITIEACEIYKLTDMSEVTIEASDWTSISGEKDIQKITLE